MVQRLGYYDRMIKKLLETFDMWIWRRMELVNWTDKIKICSFAGKSGTRKNNAGTDKEEEKKLLEPWLRRNCLLKDALEGMVYGKKVRCRRRYQMIDNIIINELYADTVRKAEKRVEWRMLSLM